MSILQNKIIEEKLLQLIDNSQFTIIFHYNTITSKEWLNLKKRLFQKQLSISHKVVPVRFFSRLLKASNLGISSANSMGGHLCLFFCSSKEDLVNLYQILFSQNGIPMKDLPQFLNLGIIQTRKFFDKDINERSSSGVDSRFENVFLSSYDIEKFLKLDSSVYSELYFILRQNGKLISEFDFFMESHLGNLSLMTINQLSLLNVISCMKNQPQSVESA